MNWGTYCRCGVSITDDMNMGLFLICRLKPNTAFCWKPSLMLRMYWFCSVMNRTSFKPLKLASSMSLTTGCGGQKNKNGEVGIGLFQLSDADDRSFILLKKEEQNLFKKKTPEVNIMEFLENNKKTGPGG